MEGTLQEQKSGYRWMRIGFLPSRAANIVKLAFLIAALGLAVWSYLELPNSDWRWANLVGLYLVAALAYINAGVWLHEQLHCLGLPSDVRAGRTHITYERKHLLILGGYYSVKGPLTFQSASHALLGPLWFSLGLLVIGCVGSLILPGWWLPLLLSLVIVSLFDMIHDLYMYSQIRRIGDKGKYWDRGKVLEVVWKD